MVTYQGFEENKEWRYMVRSEFLQPAILPNVWQRMIWRP